jgi:DNA replication licensing factor MCM4
MDLLNTGQGLQQRKLRGDLRREIISMLEQKDTSNRGMRYNEVIKAMEAQSSLPIDTVEFAEVVRALENEGAVKVSGDREKRTIRRTAFGKNDE